MNEHTCTTNNNVLPNNKTDAVTMLHDLDYLRYQGNQSAINYSDIKAIGNSDWTIPGLVTKLGLTSKYLLTPTQFANPLKGYTSQQTNEIGQQYFNKVLTNPKYIKRFAELGVDIR